MYTVCVVEEREKKCDYVLKTIPDEISHNLLIEYREWAIFRERGGSDLEINTLLQLSWFGVVEEYTVPTKRFSKIWFRVEMFLVGNLSVRAEKVLYGTNAKLIL